MPLYKVTLTLTQEELIKYLNENKTFDGRIEADSRGDLDGATDEGPAELYTPAHAQRPKRKSKVVETILESLKDGESAPEMLRGALSSAGLSENSLSTGLAILQKDGRIKRNDSGNYYLAREEA